MLIFPMCLFLWLVFLPREFPPAWPGSTAIPASRDILDTSAKPPKRTRKGRDRHDRWPIPKSR